MASVTLNVSDRHAPGVVVGAYPRANWAAWQLPPSGTAVGAATATGIVAADGTVTITGLADSTPYYAGRSTGASGYVSFSTPLPGSGGGAPLASPTFTGTPTAPTAAAGTNTTQLATAAFVAAAIAANGPFVQHVRFSTFTVAASGTTDVVVTWPVAFADTSYTVAASVQDSVLTGTNGPLLRLIVSKTTTTVTVRVGTVTAVPSGEATLNLIGVRG